MKLKEKKKARYLSQMIKEIGKLLMWLLLTILNFGKKYMTEILHPQKNAGICRNSQEFQEFAGIAGEWFPWKKPEYPSTSDKICVTKLFQRKIGLHST